jgi:hypothetical protein
MNWPYELQIGWRYRVALGAQGFLETARRRA